MRGRKEEGQNKAQLSENRRDGVDCSFARFFVFFHQAEPGHWLGTEEARARPPSAAGARAQYDDRCVALRGCVLVDVYARLVSLATTSARLAGEAPRGTRSASFGAGGGTRK